MSTVRSRLFRRLVIDPSGCLLWIGATDRNGYGLIWGDAKTRLVHRLAYELMVGPIPDGLTLDHLCRVRNCVHPDHLEPVTQRINALRGQTVNAMNAAKSQCDNGHAFDEVNTYYPPGTRRRECRECSRDRGRRYWQRKRASKAGAS